MAKRKRGNSEGSVYQMQDGRWRGAVTTGWKLNAAGKKIPARLVITKPTRHEVAEEMTKTLRDQQRGINIAPGKLTVGQFLQDWLTAIKSDVTPSTFVSYENTVRLHLIPAVGDLRLSKFGAPHVQRLKDDTIKAVVKVGPRVKKPVEGEPPPEPQHLSSSTVRYCLKVLRMALDHACKLDLVPRNVALFVDFPKVEHAEIEPFTAEQAMKFIEAAKGHRLGALFSVATAIGLRKGEALGLKWPAIDFERGTLAVRIALQRVKMPGEKKGKLLLTEPKRKSRRTINLPRVCVSALIEHRTIQEQEKLLAGSRWQEADYVFTTGIGTPMEPRNLERAYRQILALAGLHHIRIHDLRHTAATLLLTQGVHPRVVMELLGHSQIAITMNTYSHVVPALMKEAANQMDAALKTPEPVTNTFATKPATRATN
jgi:integrase